MSAQESQQGSPWYVDFFNNDYIRIYAPFLPQDHTEQEIKHILQLLQLPPESRLLDLCCGYGRHTIPLARQGYAMTGFDLSEILLQKARQQAESEQVQVRWQRGDMQQLPFTQEFDAVINIFTSFGYLPNDEADQKVLRQVYQTLKPGGLFLIETVYQPRVLRHTSPHGIIRYDDGLIVLEERHIDLLHSRNEVHISLITPDGQRTEYQQSIRIYTLTEMVQMLTQAGFVIQEYYGDLNGAPLTLDSRLVIVSKKE
jgi:SAM-dependent methyltransferase